MLHRHTASLSELFGRAEKVSLNERRADLFEAADGKSPKKHEIYTQLSGDGLDAPLVVVPHMWDTEDFYATLATFYPERSPISAYSHVIGRDMKPLFDGAERAALSAPLQIKKIHRSMLGVALGETALHAFSANESASVPEYSAARRSLSYSIARASCLFGQSMSPSTLSSRWSELRRLSGLPVFEAISSAVVKIYEAGNGDQQPRESGISNPSFSEAVSSVLSGRVDDLNPIRNFIANAYPRAGGILEEFRGPFDGRMSAFTRFVKEVQKDSKGAPTDELAVGYACDCIHPGSFSHVGALIKLVEFFPHAVLWYGCFSALSGSSGSSRVDPGIVWKLQRDLVESFSFSQRPKCDIELDELRVLLRVSERGESLRPVQPRLLTVALLPGVEIMTRFGASSDAGLERSRREREAQQLDLRVIQLLDEALHHSSLAMTLRQGNSPSTPTRRPRRDR